MRVLVVDDEKDLRAVARFSLEAAGHVVFEAHDGASAMAMAGDLLPDLILLDSVMPYGRGSRVLRELQNHPETLFIPVIVWTAHSEAQHLSSLLDRGAVTYLVKPFSIRKLVSLVEDVGAMSPAQRERMRGAHLAELGPRTTLTRRG